MWINRNGYSVDGTFILSNQLQDFSRLLLLSTKCEISPLEWARDGCCSRVVISQVLLVVFILPSSISTQGTKCKILQCEPLKFELAVSHCFSVYNFTALTMWQIFSKHLTPIQVLLLICLPWIKMYLTSLNICCLNTNFRC